MCWWKFLLLWLLFTLSHMSWQQCNETFRIPSSTYIRWCRYSLSGEPALTIGSFSFLYYRFLLFLCSSVLPMSQSLCGSVGLSVIHLKILKTRYYKVASDLWNKKMIKSQWLTLGQWGCPLHNNPKLVMGWPNSR